MNTSIDLSAIVELRPLAKIVATLNDAARGVARRWLIVGATARDLVLHHAHHLPITRATVDLDIGVAVESWTAFEELRERLVKAGASPVRHVVHRLSLRGWTIDIVPFGGIEQDGVIEWPPAGDTEMSVLGFNEASEHAVEVVLPNDVRSAVASPPALLLLKLIAWDGRHRTLPRHDGYDIRTLIVGYAGDWNADRLYAEADDLLQTFEFDNGRASAALLGRDAAAIAAPATASRVLAILKREAAGDTLLLAQDMGFRAAENLELLRAVLHGFLTPT